MMIIILRPLWPPEGPEEVRHVRRLQALQVTGLHRLQELFAGTVTELREGPKTSHRVRGFEALRFGGRGSQKVFAWVVVHAGQGPQHRGQGL